MFLSLAINPNLKESDAKSHIFIENKNITMKKYLKAFLLFFIVLISGALTSCQEETVQPGNKEGNISGQDDWEKHNG